MVLKGLKAKILGAKPAPAEARDFLASEQFQPVFFLSTGRCGTRWFTELLQKNSRLSVHHNTDPELYEQSLLAYQLEKTNQSTDNNTQKLLAEIVYAARQDLMLEAVEKKKRFVETNNRITFFTPTLAECFPHAKFVHLYRDPAGFVKSGMNRDWYNGGKYDFARPYPVTEPEASKWKDASRVAKISWLWRETNQLIDQYLSTLPADRYRRFNFSGLNTDAVSSLMQWLDIELKPNVISKQLNQKVNAQKTGNFPSWPEWPASDQRDFLKEVADYAAYLGFTYKL